MIQILSCLSSVRKRAVSEGTQCLRSRLLAKVVIT